MSACCRSNDGLFAPSVELGEEVAEGQTIGQLIRVDELQHDPVRIVARSSGLILARRAAALTQRGDCLFVIARPVV